MQTSGSLSDRALVVVLLELANRKETGVLRISQPARVVELTLVDGALGKMLWDQRAPGERIGQILLRERAITVDQLQECLAQQERTLRRLGEILVDFGYATSEMIADALREQALESCEEVLAWHVGDFRFSRNADRLSAPDFEPIDVPDLVTNFVADADAQRGCAQADGRVSRRISKSNHLMEFGKTMALFGAIGLGCALSLQLVLLDRFNLFRGPKPLIVESDALRHGVAHFSVNRLKRALEIHRWLEGRYPERLDDLVRAGLVQPSDVHYPFHSTYVYVPTDGGYVLDLPLR